MELVDKGGNIARLIVIQFDAEVVAEVGCHTVELVREEYFALVAVEQCRNIVLAQQSAQVGAGFTEQPFQSTRGQ